MPSVKQEFTEFPKLQFRCFRRDLTPSRIPIDFRVASLAAPNFNRFIPPKTARDRGVFWNMLWLRKLSNLSL
jgi:hypothetical protein